MKFPIISLAKLKEKSVTLCVKRGKSMKYNVFTYLFVFVMLFLMTACSTAHYCNCG